LKFKEEDVFDFTCRGVREVFNSAWHWWRISVFPDEDQSHPPSKTKDILLLA